VLITVFDTAEEVAVAAADQVCDAIAMKPSAVLGLPAGQTPVPLYAELRRRHRNSEVDFSQVTTFNLDEFVGLAPDAPGSFRRFMTEQFFCGVNVDASRIGFLDGRAADIDTECLRYEAAIAAAGGIDLQALGIGANGHIGFNEPGDELIATTHLAMLQPGTRQANAALFGGDVSRVPESALTVGIGTILAARELLLIATGERKAECVARMVEGGLTTHLPASLLQLHPRVRVFLDRSAALRLA
jgi:glucosamine-6-phosphate deaminase